MKQKPMGKTAKIFCVTGSTLLILMGGFHGSGIFYITEKINASNLSDFLKEIFPALFVHPSIHLLSLASFGILAVFAKNGAKMILTLLSILVFIDAALGFYLGGPIPGILLSVAALCFVVSASKL